MRSNLAHIQFIVHPEHMGFYRDLFSFLEWGTIYDGDVGGGVQMLGVRGSRGEGGESLWFIGQVKDGTANDYDGPGANHFAIGTETQADVDAAADFLTKRGVALLFETPRHRPEFSTGAGNTYYQIMFASPDHILWEVVYTGPKA